MVRVSVDRDRAELEQSLVASYEAYVALKSIFRNGTCDPTNLYLAILQEMRMQRYLHALLGFKGEPPGLLY
jgi:hypothetical protein